MKPGRYREPVPALYTPLRNADVKPYLVMVCGESSVEGDAWLEFRFVSASRPSGHYTGGYYWARAGQFSYGPNVVAEHVASALEGK